MRKTLFIIVVCIYHNFCFSQSDCKVDLAKNSMESNDFLISSKIHEDKILLNLENHSSDTLYVFSSYFDKDYSSSYLIRLNTKKNVIKYSFLPFVKHIIPFWRKHVIIFGDKRVISEGEFFYEFICFPPNSSQMFLISNNFDQSLYVEDFELENKSFLDEININLIEANPLVNYSKTIEFAVYKDISGLCDFEYYRENTEQYYKKAENYKVYISTIKN